MTPRRVSAPIRASTSAARRRIPFTRVAGRVLVRRRGRHRRRDQRVLASASVAPIVVHAYLSPLGSCGRTTRQAPPISIRTRTARARSMLHLPEWTVDWTPISHTIDGRSAGRVSRRPQRHRDGAHGRGADDESRTRHREAPGHGWRQSPGGSCSQPIYLLRNVGGGDWKIWVNGVSDQQSIPSQATARPTSRAGRMRAHHRPAA